MDKFGKGTLKPNMDVQGSFTFNNLQNPVILGEVTLCYGGFMFYIHLVLSSF